MKKIPGPYDNGPEYEGLISRIKRTFFEDPVIALTKKLVVERLGSEPVHDSDVRVLLANDEPLYYEVVD